ncbi:MAG: hypothetical protein ACK5NF_03920 [Bacilli bacterium]
MENPVNRNYDFKDLGVEKEDYGKYISSIEVIVEIERNIAKLALFQNLNSK